MSYIDKRPATIFCDIDGTLIQHVNPTEKTNQISTVNILPGTLQKIKLWDSKNYNIILTTGRKESLRKITEEELSKVGIIYDKLIMGKPSYDLIVDDKSLFFNKNWIDALKIKINYNKY